MEKGQIWTVVGISLIVAVIASIATATITGNFIAVDPIGKATSAFVYTTKEVYNKSEIDYKLNAMNMKFSDSNNVGIAINKRIYSSSSDESFPSFSNSVVARCKDLSDVPLSGYCKTTDNKAIGNHGVLIYDKSLNTVGGFACSIAGSTTADLGAVVYCLDVE